MKVVLDAQGLALYFSRAPIPWWRDGFAAGIKALPEPRPLRHVGIYGYRAGFLREFPRLAQAPIEVAEALEQLRALWHGHRIAVHVTATAPGHRRRHARGPGARARPVAPGRRVRQRKGVACYPLCQ